MSETRLDKVLQQALPQPTKSAMEKSIFARIASDYFGWLRTDSDAGGAIAEAHGPIRSYPRFKIERTVAIRISRFRNANEHH
jgi:hypothetical protein